MDFFLKSTAKKGQFMNFSQGHFGTKVQCESCLFSQGKTPEFTKKGEIHELFVLALSLVWFAGATPEQHSCSFRGLPRSSADPPPEATQTQTPTPLSGNLDTCNRVTNLLD